MATRYSIHFRQDAGSWGETETGDPTNIAALGPNNADGSQYPTTAGGLTFGWDGTALDYNYSGASDARLSGAHGTNANYRTFRIDVPDGPGPYRIWLGLGRLNATLTNSIEVVDGTSGATLLTIGATSVASGSVMDATGTVQTIAAWLSADGGTHQDITVTGDHLIFRMSAASDWMYLANIELEYQPPALQDATLQNELGTATHSGTVHPKEPAGKRIGKVSAPNSAQVFSVVSPTTYFDIEVDGSDSYLIATSNRIPDNWSGSVVVRQTANGTTRDTSIALSAGALARDTTGYLGRISSETWFQRNVVKSIIDAEKWLGYSVQSFASDVAVTGKSSFDTAVSNITPDGSSWYRIRLQNGTYTGTSTVFTGLDFGSGGLLIEPDTGHDPVFKILFTNSYVHGVQFRDCQVSPQGKAAGGQYIFQGGPTGTPYAKIRFDDCRLGHYYGDGGSYNVSNWNDWGDMMNLQFAEQVIFQNCTVRGLANFASLSGGRIYSAVGNSYQEIAKDFHGVTTAYDFNTPRGVYADDFMYVELRDEVAWNNPDIYTGLSTAQTPHGDYVQIRRTGGVAYVFQAYPNGNTSATWAPGTEALIEDDNGAGPRLYTCTGTTTAGGATAGVADPNNPPSGTGTGIVSGGAVFDYFKDYDLGTTMYLWIENACIMQDGQTINAAGNATPNVQFIINSNAGWLNHHEIITVNCMCGSGNTRGIIAGDSKINAELCSFVGPADLATSGGTTVGLNQATINGATVRARNNFVGESANALYISGSTATYSEGNKIANFSGSAASGRRPGDVMNGPFTQNAAGDWGYPTLTDDDTVTPDEFRSAMSKIMHSVDGSCGAKLRESHQISVSDGSTTRAVDLVINP